MPDLEFEKYISLLHSAFGIVPKQCEERRSEAKKTKEISFCNNRRAQVILVAMFQLRSFDDQPEDLVQALTSMDACALTQKSNPEEVEQMLGTYCKLTSPSST
jgi:hypothetical protein